MGVAIQHRSISISSAAPWKLVAALVATLAMGQSLAAQSPAPISNGPVQAAGVPQTEAPSLAGAHDESMARLADGVQQLQTGTQQLQQGVTKLQQNLKVTTVDKNWGIAFFGSLNGEMLFSESRPFLPSGVVLLFPDLGKNSRTFEAHAKSTTVGAALQGPQVLGLQSGGMFVSSLYGEQFEDDRYGFFVARAYGDLKDEERRYAIGLEGDVINPLSPTTLNFNAGNLAGNLGFFRGQFRAERYFHVHHAFQVTTQFALSNPIATSFADFDTLPANLLEDNGWPNLEGRAAWGLGEKTGPVGQVARPVEFGVSGLVGQLRRTDLPIVPNHILDVWALGADVRVAFTDYLGVKGEFFNGQCIGNYNAAILQVNNDDFGPVRSTGGWGEIYVYWNECLHSHFGYGVDDPLDVTVTPGLFAARPVRNQFGFANLIWDVTKNLEIGFEVSRWETSYANILPTDIDNQAMMYHTRVRLKF